MSVESQTAGKLDSASNEADYADEIEREISQDDRYEFLKDEVGSASSTSDNQPAEVCLNKSELDIDVCNFNQVGSMVNILINSCTLMK